MYMYVNIDSELDSDFPQKQPTDPFLVIHTLFAASPSVPLKQSFHST